MSQLMSAGKTETMSTGNGCLYVVEFRRSKADGLTWDIKNNNSGVTFAQSVYSYEMLYQARKDARATLQFLAAQFNGKVHSIPPA